MKNYHFKLFIISFAFLLSGCGLVHFVESVALLPVAIVDGVVGTNMTGSITSGLNELEKPGKKMDKQSIQIELSGKTIYPYGAVAYLNTNGESLFKDNKESQVKKYKWFAKEDGIICIAKDVCYGIRKKDNSILYGKFNEQLIIKRGDTDNLFSLFDRQQKQEAEKKAELERKKAEEKAAQERAEAEQKLAQQKAEVEQKRLAEAEERCMKTPSCRAKKEREQRQREHEQHQRDLASQRQKAKTCDRLYVGKTVVFGRSCLIFFGCTDVPGEIIGLSKENGVATVKSTGQVWHGQTVEKSCSDLW